MEFQFHLPLLHLHESTTSTIFTITFLFLILTFLLKWKHKNSKSIRNPPQPSGSWPLIGHLHLLGNLPHISLGTLADKYGPIFMIKLGVHPVLVVSSPEIAKECLGANDKVFSGRPKTIFVEHLAYDAAMLGFSPYGTYWREMRKIITLKLLSNKMIENLSHYRASEVRSALKSIHGDCLVRGEIESRGALVEMKQWFNEINLNSTLRLIVGKPLKDLKQGGENAQWFKTLREWMNLAGSFVPADAIPFLRKLDIGGYERAMVKLAKEIDHLPKIWVEEHKKKRGSENGGDPMGSKDFIDVMLEIFENGQDMPSQFDSDTVIKATCMAMILGGTDSAAVTLTWALSLLLNNKEVLKRVQAELEAQVGKQRQVNESDLKNLIYLQAVLKETMRLYPAFPLSVTREATTDCIVNGYHIPAGTRLFINLYKMHRDPLVWADPMEFRPERFLMTHKDCDIRGQNFELLPFGSGRRVCPGISFALQAMQFTLASLLHGFDVSTLSSEKVDMAEGVGLTNLKASPLEVILQPRLRDELY